MNKLDPCGIEVSARELVVALARDGVALPCRCFPNTASGHRALLGFLRGRGRSVRVCLEATGWYGLDLALALQARRGVEVMIANPRAVRHFAQALMQRSKTDRLDAAVLREYAARMPFQPWQPPPATALHLTALARRIATLTDQCSAEKNRWHAATLSPALPAALRQDLQRSIRFHQTSIQRLLRQALRLLAADAHLQRQFDLLQSIPGIGPLSAVQTLGELVRLSSQWEVRQWVAHAGLDPREQTSGSSLHKKPRISKAGNRYLRRALYMPALVAVRHQPHFRAFYQRLLARGKHKLLALTAVMRKLLHAIYGMFKHDQPFCGAQLFCSPQSAPGTPTEAA